MKKIRMAALYLAAALLLTACGQPAAKNEAPAPDMQKLYEQMQAAVETPEMAPVPENRRSLILGIEDADVRQAVTMLCGDSVRADELWLIEAADEAAAERIEALAEQRLAQRSREMESYLPEQYAVLQQARLIREGRCLALLVSPEAETLETLFRQALQG